MKNQIGIGLLFCIFFGLTNSASCQNHRFCDMAISIDSPASNHIFTSPGFDSCILRIKNLGLDTISPNDMYSITLNFGGWRMLPVVRPYSRQLNPGDSLKTSIVFKMKGTNDVDNVKFCVQEFYSFTPPPPNAPPNLLPLFDETDSVSLYFNNTCCIIGSHKYVSIHSLEISEILKVYPNPVINTLHIDFESTRIGSSICETYDLNGKLLLTCVLDEKNNSIDVSSLNKGIFILKIWSDSTFQTLRFVKS
ncbi:MAG: T9SS type A sorting domain-containing protein [Bacteroidetes bacterium]|nr:T9SS type A sorting domain-containing protein [Bacteroidota bacterium]